MGLAGTGPLVDLQQGLVLGGVLVLVALPLFSQEVEVAHEPVEKTGFVLLVVAQGPQQGEQAHAALAGHSGASGGVAARLVLHVELDPLSPVGVDGAGDQLVLAQVAEPESLAGLEDHSRGAHELGDHDPLGSVHDERSLVGHNGEVAQEHDLLDDLAGEAVREPGLHQDGRRVGHVLLFAFLHRGAPAGTGVQVFIVGVELQLELEVLREVFDGADVAEGIGQALADEPLEGVLLHCDEVG